MIHAQTMVATRFAAVSGLDCAVMSGGDIGLLGKVLNTKQTSMFELTAIHRGLCNSLG